jgi:hypothetical protein
LQDGVAAAFEMVDIADLLLLALARFQQFLQPRLALAERQAAEIFATGEQQVERIEDQALAVAVRQRRLQARKIRRAVMVERNDLAIDQHVGKQGRFLRDRLELVGPVEPLAGV